MQDILGIMANLNRPRLLVRAARLGADEYCRETHLQRHLGYGALPKFGQALMRLIEIEGVLNEQRSSQDASYSLVRHVDVLIAMMGESRMLRASSSGM